MTTELRTARHALRAHIERADAIQRAEMDAREAAGLPSLTEIAVKRALERTAHLTRNV